MKKSLQTFQRHPAVQFNLTAMIDVVFILFTFFMLICRSIGRENFRVTLPDDCPAVVAADPAEGNVITVSIFSPADALPGDKAVLYAVRDQTYDPQGELYKDASHLLIEALTEQIIGEVKLKGDSPVYLRADKNLTYGQVQNALLALAQAKVETIHLAAYRVVQKTGPDADR